MKKRIISALLATVMVMDLASVPVAATETPSVSFENAASEVSASEEAQTHTEQAAERNIVSLEACENSAAYAALENGEKQFVVAAGAFQENKSYTVEIRDAHEQCTVKEVVADEEHSLQIPFDWKADSIYEVMVVDGDTAYSCEIDTADTAAPAGVPETYAAAEDNTYVSGVETELSSGIAAEPEASTADTTTEEAAVSALSEVFQTPEETSVSVLPEISQTPEEQAASALPETAQATAEESPAIALYSAVDENGSYVPPVVEVPGTVDWLNVESLDGMVNLSWGAAVNATEYDIYYYSWSDKANLIYAGSTALTSYTVTDLPNGEGYTFHIVPKNTSAGYPVYSSVDPASSWKSSTRLKFVKPSVVSSFNVTQTDAGNQLSWTYSGGRLTGYILYYYDYNAGTYRRLATLDASATSYVQTGTKKDDRYKYAVRPYRMENGVYYGADMTEKIIYGNSVIDETLDAVHPMFYTAYTKKRVGVFRKKNQKSSKDYIRVLKKGTKVTVIMNDPYKPKIKLEDGTVGYTWRGAIRLAVEHYTTKDYTDEQKEIFVNSKGYSSKTKYFVWIATYTQKIYVFKGSRGKWKLIRTCKAATGAIDTPDYPGEEKIVGKKRRHVYGKRFYQYLSIMSDGNTIHTRPSWRSNGKPVDARLGRPLSHGCVRVSDPDGAFIYNTCGKNTKVLIY